MIPQDVFAQTIAPGGNGGGVIHLQLSPQDAKQARQSIVRSRIMLGIATPEEFDWWLLQDWDDRFNEKYGAK